ncbi:unnamed protein product [Effrenium voratum]|nr:unnamed protein product [Effrenium voratum]
MILAWRRGFNLTVILWTRAFTVSCEVQREEGHRIFDKAILLLGRVRQRDEQNAEPEFRRITARSESFYPTSRIARESFASPKSSELHTAESRKVEAKKGTRLSPGARH